MATTTLTRVRWQLAHVLRAIGLPGQAALALLVGAALIQGAIVLPLALRVERLAEVQAEDEQGLARLRAHPPSPVASPARQLEVFQDRFPGERELSPMLGKLLDVARKHSVRLDQGEFKFVSEASEPLQRYSIVLPAKAEYRSLRRFMQEILRDQPAVALVDMNLRRSDPKSTVIEAQMHFVLFLRRPT